MSQNASMKNQVPTLKWVYRNISHFEGDPTNLSIQGIIADRKMIVQIDEGRLRGTEGKSILTGETYYSFLGIPYGKPPTGDRRFLAPEPTESWNGIYDATYERDDCAHFSLFLEGGKFTGSEDCLYLNVYTPQKPSSIRDPKPVLLNIHGGGFFSGSGSRHTCSPDYLMEHDVIVVSINYRLHILGFLNLGLPECPGNAGMKDQVLALKWVQKNIQHFGGDPQNVTIIGVSSGGVSVHLHLLSPLSRGLFQKAVSLCGYTYSPGAFTYKPLEVAYSAAQKLGFQGSKDDREGMLRLFKEQSYENIANAANKDPSSGIRTIFTPSLETHKEGAFLPDNLEELAENVYSVPVISGINDGEGIVLHMFLPNEKTVNENIERIITSIPYNTRIDPEELPNTVAKIRQLYIGEETEANKVAEGLVNLSTDMMCYYFEEAHDPLIKSSNSTYLYNFAYVADSRTLSPEMKERIRNLKGAAHGEDYNVLFHGTYGYPNWKCLSEADQTVIRGFSTLLSNFAKTGNPNPDTSNTIWRPSTVNDQCHLRIDFNFEMINGPVLGDRLQRLKSILGYTLKAYNCPDYI